MAIAAGKGAKAQKIDLEEQASRWSSAYPIARCCRLRWELPQRDAGRAGETVPQASRASLPPVPVPNPRERSGRQTPQALTTPPDSAASPDP
jgi:hypothetical protein